VVGERAEGSVDALAHSVVGVGEVKEYPEDHSMYEVALHRGNFFRRALMLSLCLLPPSFRGCPCC